jgi:hypothetical protein
MVKLFQSRKKSYKLIIIFILLSKNLFSLSAQTIEGKIVTDNQTPIEYANIMLLNATDSSFVDGTITSKLGVFSIANVSHGDKIVKISYLGYLTKFIDLKLEQNQVDLDEIILLKDTNLLNEVVITASVPLFSRKNNTLVVNVENTLLSSIGTANDVIKRIPGISIQEEKITVFSKGLPIIYINNRKIYDRTELQRLQSNEISTIELMTNPGAKYDAEGRAVLLIKTKKNKENGWAVRVSEQLKKRKHFDDTENIGLNYMHNNLALFTSYHHSIDKSEWTTQSDYTVYNDRVWQQTMYMPQNHKELTNQLTAGMDWSITPKHAIGWQYQTVFSNERIKSKGSQSIRENNTEYDKIATVFDSKYQPDINLLNAFYIGNYSKLFNLRLDMDYMNIHNKTVQNNIETSLLENRNVHIENQSDIRLYAGKLTMTYNFSETSNLEFGGELNQIENSGFLMNPEQYVKNSIYTNNEIKTAGFVSYNTHIGKLNLQLGIRYDWVHLKSTEDSIRQIKINRTYQGFYPNISLSQTVGNTQMGLEFSRKIQRPAFAMLSNNDYYINRFLQEKGNPHLQSEDIYQIDYLLKYKIFDLKLGYIYKHNPIGVTIASMEDNASQTLMTYINYTEQQELNALLTTNFEYKIWQSQITVGLNQPFFRLNYLEEQQKRNQLSFSFDFSNDIVFPQEYIFSLNFAYNSKSHYYVTESKENKTVDIGLRKYFFGKKLLVNLQVNDLFDWISNQSIIRMNNVSYIKTSNYETRSLILTVRYQFNNYAKKYRGKNAAKDDMRRL